MEFEIICPNCNKLINTYYSGCYGSDAEDFLSSGEFCIGEITCSYCNRDFYVSARCRVKININEV